MANRCQYDAEYRLAYNAFEARTHAAMQQVVADIQKEFPHLTIRAPLRHQEFNLASESYRTKQRGRISHDFEVIHKNEYYNVFSLYRQPNPIATANRLERGERGDITSDDQRLSLKPLPAPYPWGGSPDRAPELTLGHSLKFSQTLTPRLKVRVRVRVTPSFRVRR
jgi:hypothetical protein